MVPSRRSSGASFLPDEKLTWEFVRGEKGWGYTGNGWKVQGPDEGSKPMETFEVSWAGWCCESLAQMLVSFALLGHVRCMVWSVASCCMSGNSHLAKTSQAVRWPWRRLRPLAVPLGGRGWMFVEAYRTAGTVRCVLPCQRLRGVCCELDAWCSVELFVGRLSRRLRHSHASLFAWR